MRGHGKTIKKMPLVLPPPPPEPTILDCCEAEEESMAAVTYTYSLPDGTLWAANGEYETQINYCPFCGKPAKTRRDDS